MKKFKIATLGCRTNQYESEGYATQLRSLGYKEVKEGEKADICVVNTCTVTASADSSSRHEIRQLAKKHPGAKLVVTGCLAEKLPHMPEVSLVVLNAKKESLLNLALPEEENLPEFKIDQFGGHTRAFVKVQDGCNSFCTYCIIPYVRGRSRSREMEDILEEIKGLIRNGYKEVVLTGINIGDFVTSKNERLADLVRAVDQLDGLERIRISSIDPDEVDDSLAEVVLKGKKTCPSLHLVLQSGSNTILKRMNRKYTRQMFLESVYKMKRDNSDFTFTTDIIVGFPGESEIDFQETLELMREVEFAKVHMFPYSPRERTRAALFPHQVPSLLLAERKQILLREAEKTAFSLREKYVGKKVKVLVETEEPCTGHTTHFLSVILPKGYAKRNEIVEVLCRGNSPEGLIC